MTEKESDKRLQLQFTVPKCLSECWIRTWTDLAQPVEETARPKPVAMWPHQEGLSHHQHCCGSLRPRCCGLFNDDVTKSGYMASYEVGLVKKKVKIMSKEVVVT
jgi:hypothetical protein